MDRRKLFLIVDDYEADLPFFVNEAEILRQKYELTVVSLTEKNNKYKSETDNVLFLKHKAGLYLPGALRYLFSTVCREEIIRIFADRCGIRQKIRRVLTSANFYSSGVWFWKQFQKEITGDYDGSIIYTFWCNYPTLAFLLNRNGYRKCRYISRIHGYDLYDERNPSGRQPFKWYINENIDKLVFIGSIPQDYYLMRHRDLDRKKAELCRLGIKPIKTEYKDDIGDKFILVSCATVIPLKRIELIIEALKEYKGETEIQWIHFGGGELLDEMRDKASSYLNDKKNVSYEFKGYISNSAVRDFYSMTRVGCFITTSSTEGCPVSVMEAMSAEIPIIGTGVGDIPHMIQGNGILLSKDPTTTEISEAIERLTDAYNNRTRTEEYNSMRSRSKELFDEMFDADKNTEQFIRNVLEA